MVPLTCHLLLFPCLPCPSSTSLFALTETHHTVTSSGTLHRLCNILFSQIVKQLVIFTSLKYLLKYYLFSEVCPGHPTLNYNFPTFQHSQIPFCWAALFFFFSLGSYHILTDCIIQLFMIFILLLPYSHQNVFSMRTGIFFLSSLFIPVPQIPRTTQSQHWDTE